MELRDCSRCKKELPRTSEYFARRKSSKDGLEYHCKECNRKRSKEHYEENKDWHLNRRREYYHSHLDEMQQYRDQNREYLREKNKENYYNNLEYFKEKEKRWRKTNPDKNKAKYTRNRYIRKSRMLSVESNFTEEDWNRCKSHFNDTCSYCGEKKPLQREHFVPLANKGEYTINNIIPACSRCNASKNNRNFFEWYPKQKYYSKRREQKILKYLGYNRNHIQQLSIL
jgi:hypothetical protein